MTGTESFTPDVDNDADDFFGGSKTSKVRT